MESGGYGPWKDSAELGREVSSLKQSMSRLEKGHGSVPWLAKQLENLERKVMRRSPTPLPDIVPVTELFPEDFWICPKLTQVLEDNKMLQKVTNDLQKTVAMQSSQIKTLSKHISVDRGDEYIGEVGNSMETPDGAAGSGGSAISSASAAPAADEDILRSYGVGL